jgi:hypothetical protein
MFTVKAEVKVTVAVVVVSWPWSWVWALTRLSRLAGVQSAVAMGSNHNRPCIHASVYRQTVNCWR